MGDQACSQDRRPIFKPLLNILVVHKLKGDSIIIIIPLSYNKDMSKQMLFVGILREDYFVVNMGI